MPVNNWTILHHILIHVNDRSLTNFADFAAEIFVNTVVRAKQPEVLSLIKESIEQKLNQKDFIALNKVFTLYKELKFLYEVNTVETPSDLLIYAKNYSESILFSLQSDPFVKKWLNILQEPLALAESTLPLHFSSLQFAQYTLQPTPPHFKNAAVYENQKQERFLFKQSRHLEDILASTIASTIAHPLYSNILPTQAICSEEGEVFLAQPFLAKLKTIIPRHLDCITTLNSMSQNEQLRSKFSKESQKDKSPFLIQFCHILAASFLVADWDVHLGNIVLNKKILYKIDHDWALDELGQIKTLSFFGKRNIFNTVHHDRFPPSNALRDYQDLINLPEFFDALRGIADQAEKTLKTTLTHVHNTLLNTLNAFSEEEKQKALMKLMQRLGSQFSNKEYQLDSWCEEIVTNIGKGLQHRIHSMKLMAMCSKLYELENPFHKADPSELEQQLHLIQDYLLHNVKEREPSANMIPLEVQTLIRQGLKELKRHNMKTNYSLLAKWFVTDNVYQFKFFQAEKQPKEQCLNAHYGYQANL